MDINKKPGISFDDVILKELVFSRKEGYSEKPMLNMQLESKFSFSLDKKNLNYEMTCKINDEGKFFNIKCTMIGFFSIIEGHENMSLREYANTNAPAAVFPYIREAIASTTTRAGIPPVVIPPTNLNLLKKNAGIEDEASQFKGTFNFGQVGHLVARQPAGIQVFIQPLAGQSARRVQAASGNAEIFAFGGRQVPFDAVQELFKQIYNFHPGPLYRYRPF
ncbi:MAG: protein-export chaperone SecB [Treponema sp.]|nr:protein-export chaperone SecB [Treponema sp.]